MTRCLQICGAYSFRLTRKHSTVFLIAGFIITIIMILELYTYRRQGHPHIQQRIGDFDYHPGGFLEGRMPNENVSYCEFNYGLPVTLKWGTFSLYSSPEAGSKGSYKVIYNAIRGKAYANYSKHEAVTYSTQATPEFMYHIIEIARFWDGPISLAVFVPGYDLDIAMQIMAHLCHCFPGMSKVSMHLFYPQKYPPVIMKKEEIIVTTETPTASLNISDAEIMQRKLDFYRNLNNKTRYGYIEWARKKKIRIMMKRMPKVSYGNPRLKFKDCSGVESLGTTTFRRQNRLVYPINVGRNVARNASATNYFLVSDIEMVPSDGLAPKFLTMVKNLMGEKKRNEDCVFAKTVFVVPLFEVEHGEEIPRDKNTLVRLVAANRAMYFHQKFCSHCQRFPGLQSWLTRESPGIIEPMLIARREYPYHRWEPLYFGTHKEPWYSEMLSWEGRQDKMTQMLEMCLQEYRMVVLDGAFLCHAAASKSAIRHTTAEKINTQRYMKIIGAMKKKYPERPQCKVNWKC